MCLLKKGLRGGISYIAKRYSKTNNKYMQSYDACNQVSLLHICKQICFMIGQGANICSIIGFKRLSQNEINKFLLNLIGCSFIEEKSPDGNILEFDLEYPDKLHELHNDCPLAPEKRAISHDMLSRYCSNIEVWHKNEGVNELVPNLGNKSKYVLHYENLQLYLTLEMKLATGHKILNFKQSNWFKKCIDFNTDKRKNPANSFEKEFFQLMSNSTFGKTMENFRKKCTLD